MHSAIGVPWDYAARSQDLVQVIRKTKVLFFIAFEPSCSTIPTAVKTRSYQRSTFTCHNPQLLPQTFSVTAAQSTARALQLQRTVRRVLSRSRTHQASFWLHALLVPVFKLASPAQHQWQQQNETPHPPPDPLTGALPTHVTSPRIPSSGLETDMRNFNSALLL